MNFELDEEKKITLSKYTLRIYVCVCLYEKKEEKKSVCMIQFCQSILHLFFKACTVMQCYAVTGIGPAPNRPNRLVHTTPSDLDRLYRQVLQ